jgi:predicted DsbA family dithiol-disulfide isomerase
MLVEAWSDIVCPWCYIGKRRLEAALDRFEHADQVEVRWRSFELDPHAPFLRTGRMAEHLASKYGMTLAQAEERLEGLNRLAAADGLDYDLARTQGGNTFAAHRLLHLAYSRSDALGGALKEALLAAYFVDLRPISEPEVLEDVAVGVGLDRDEVIEVLGSDRFAAEVRADEAEAARLGCTGVPFFVVDRAFAIPGAQDVDTFLLTLRRAWERANPIETVGGAAGACGPDGCPV